MTRPAVLVIGGLLAALLAGCAGGTGTGSGPAGRAPGTASYVALGDSFTAGPFVPTTDLAGGCLRSDHDYPSLLAARLGVRHFDDVSCSGAETTDLTSPQHPVPDATIPPQLRAVRPGTDLVTVGIGGNDFGLFATLVGTCTRLRASDPQGDPCTRRLTSGPDRPDAVARRIGQRVTRVLRQVTARAPHATVLLVGYLRLVPDRGRCPALPLAAGDYAEGRRIGTALNDALAAAARRADVRFVDMDAVSRGHDICADDPWVNGARTDRARALAYHPFEAGMRAVARQVEARLRSEGS